MIKCYKKGAVLGLGFLALLTLSGCASYKARPLIRLMPAGSSQCEDGGPVSFAYRVFDRNDCKKYLDRDVIKQGYQPILISIKNNSNQTLYFSRKQISLVTVDAHDVAQTVHTNTAGRAAGYGVCALVVWPLAIPAIVDGVGSAKANEQLDSDFSGKQLCDQTIQPHEIINGLIFVPVESFKPAFEITLTSSDGGEPLVLKANEFLMS